MYLTDEQLKERLPELGIVEEHDHDNFRFDADRQIGPCSIDLRISSVYWTRKRRLGREKAPLVLDRAHLMEISPSRGWRRHSLDSTDRIQIRPGGLVLGRVAERLRIPSDCAGRLEGRSSFARLGLYIVASGNFINPGWKGHMPIVIVNHSDVTIQIPVGAPLVQLVLIQLGQRPAKDYGERDGSLYKDDQGGPSFWWRDEQMKAIRGKLNTGTIENRVFSELDDVLDQTPDDEFLTRLETFVAASSKTYGNADDLLSDFAGDEDRRSKRAVVKHWIASVLLLALAGMVIPWLWNTTWHPAIRLLMSGVFVLAVVLAGIKAATTEHGFFLTTSELSRLERRPRKAVP